MPIKSRRVPATPEAPRRFYAFVDSVVEALPDRPHSRMSIHLDVIDANMFEGDHAAIENDDALFLTRISTTPRRLEQLFGLEPINVKESDWFHIQLQREPNMPRAWLLPFVGGYEPQPPVNAVVVDRLDDDSEIVGRLENSCVAPQAERIEGDDALATLVSAVDRGDLRITALDVGQAACVAFSTGSRTFGYFDVGAPMFFNKRSFPRRFRHTIADRGFVILSHWDFDHFALAFQYPELKRLKWFAPEQPVGPNTARFQRSLGSRLKFVSGDIDLGKLLLKRCSGTSPRDRNSTGYAARIELDDAGILLPGDADYQSIPSTIKIGANRLMMPHHGGTGTAPPAPGGSAKAIAVASYGLPNTYHHPDENQVDAHRRAGWRIRRTAAHGNPARPRGDRVLYPT
jgi:beta-lactamase superfamily II metal-dependent hydrolase